MDFQEVVSRLFSKITKIRQGDRNVVTVALHHLNLYEFVTTTPIVHVTGSKGKGTTATFAATLLHRTCACEVGVYMSPHILTVRERIGFNGFEFVDEDAFVRAYRFCEMMLPPNIMNALNYYETIFIMAMVIFGIHRRVSMMVIEVHLGGLYDATNVFVNTPVVAVTDVTMEHCDRLGDSVDEILANKLGIVMPGTRAVITTSRMLDRYGLIFRSQCFNAKLLYGDAIVGDIYKCRNREFLSDPIIAQALSFAVYIDAIWRNCSPLPFEAVLKHMQQIVPLPARRQRLVVGEAEIFLDGAHTVESFTRTVQWFNNNHQESTRKILLVTLTGDRCIDSFCDIIHAGQFDEVWFTAPVSTVSKYDAASPVCESSLHYEYARKCRELTRRHHATFAATLNPTPSSLLPTSSTSPPSPPPPPPPPSSRCFCHESVQDAFSMLFTIHDPTKHNYSVLISGSMYLCAAVLEYLNKL